MGCQTRYYSLYPLPLTRVLKGHLALLQGDGFDFCFSSDGRPSSHLMLAIRKRQIEVAKWILEGRYYDEADENDPINPARRYPSALDEAVDIDDLELVEMILEMGASPSTKCALFSLLLISSF